MEYKVTFRADGEVVIKGDAPNHEEAKVLKSSFAYKDGKDILSYYDTLQFT